MVCITVGKTAISAKYNEPGKISRFKIRCKYSSVLSVLIPGIEPPFSLIYFEIYVGFNEICV